MVIINISSSNTDDLLYAAIAAFAAMRIIII